MAAENDERSSPDDTYALDVANSSHAWYRSRAVLTRRLHRLSETALLVISAAIPVAAVLAPANATAPAILGAVIVVVTGVRSAFHWQENYLRYSAAREAVEAQRRLYHTWSQPYDDPATRDQLLVWSVTKIEQVEMASWMTIAAPGRPSEHTSAHPVAPDS